jgi:pilus assembly protein CpaB
MRAVGIRVNDVVGVGGFVLPGDRVDVLFTRTGSNEMPATDVLIQNTRVLAVDQIADEKNTEPTVAKVVTIEVNAVDAQKIALAQTLGALTLSLRSAGSLDQAPARRIVSQELTSSPSVYESEFARRRAEQAALDARLRGLEGAISNMNQRNSGDGEEEIEQPIVEVEAALPIERLTIPVDVVRGMKRQTYEVPRDASAR